MGIKRRLAATMAGFTLVLGAGVAASAPASAAVPFCTTTVAVKQANGGVVTVPSASSTALTDCYMNTSRQSTQYDSVKRMQTSLNYCHGHTLDRDGHYGPKTKSAVWNTQAALGIDQDGVFGVQTRAAMQWYGSKGCSPITNERADRTETVRVLHWNISGHVMNKNSTGSVVNTVVNRVQTFDPTFVSLNEVCYSQFSAIRSKLQAAGWPSDNANFARFAGENPRPSVCGGGKFGVAIFSKQPLGTSETTRLSDDGSGEKRWILCAPHTGDRATFCSTHITFNEPTIPTQLREVQSVLDRHYSNGRTPIVAGDFNVQPSSRSLDEWYTYAYRTTKNPHRSGSYREADENYFNNGRSTYDPLLKDANSTDPKKKIDYVFVHRTKLAGWTSVETKVGRSGSKPLSDHLTYFVTARVVV